MLSLVAIFSALTVIGMIMIVIERILIKLLVASIAFFFGPLIKASLVVQLLDQPLQR